MSNYRDTWTEEHGEDGLREKFHTYKAKDMRVVGSPLGITMVAYPEASRIGASGEFVFVLRPESDREAWLALHTYADWVEDRSPKLAREMRRELRRIRDNQPDQSEPEIFSMNDPDLPYHLRPDAQPLSECDTCHRKTWMNDVGSCLMTQPDGSRCTGVFQPIPAT